jgi:hypothetical protein
MPISTNGHLSSSEFGLALGFVIGHHFLDMQDLHYGYWPEGLPRVPQNLAQAQANYTDFLVSHIPAGVRSVLDVGCGAGNTARKLLDRGFTVDRALNGGLAGWREVLDGQRHLRDALPGSPDRPALRLMLFSEPAVHTARGRVQEGVVLLTRRLRPDHRHFPDPGGGKARSGAGTVGMRFRETIARPGPGARSRHDRRIAPTFDISTLRTAKPFSRPTS